MTPVTTAVSDRVLSELEDRELILLSCDHGLIIEYEGYLNEVLRLTHRDLWYCDSDYELVIAPCDVLVGSGSPRWRVDTWLAALHTPPPGTDAWYRECLDVLFERTT